MRRVGGQSASAKIAPNIASFRDRQMNPRTTRRRRRVTCQGEARMSGERDRGRSRHIYYYHHRIGNNSLNCSLLVARVKPVGENFWHCAWR
jgi:hypothetical protein